MTRLYLVSCAQTVLDQERVFHGASGHRLSPEGIKHATLLGKYLRTEKIDSFYSSPWEGAFQTASTLAARHRRGVMRIKDLQDMDYGKWTGKTAEEVEESDPKAFITWQFQPHQHRMPAGESIEEVQDRIVGALRRTVSVEKGNNVCVVTHAIPVRTAMCHFLNEDLSLIWMAAPQESTALNIIDFDNDEARVVAVASVEHLHQENST